MLEDNSILFICLRIRQFNKLNNFVIFKRTYITRSGRIWSGLEFNETEIHFSMSTNMTIKNSGLNRSES